MDNPEMQPGNMIVRELISWLQLAVEPYLEEGTELVSGTDELNRLCSEWVDMYCGFDVPDKARTSVGVIRSNTSWSFLDGAEMELQHITNFGDNTTHLVVKAVDASGFNYGKMFTKNDLAVRPEWFEVQRDGHQDNGELTA